MADVESLGESNAVLAFLLGSTRTLRLDAPSPETSLTRSSSEASELESGVLESLLPELEPNSDSDEERRSMMTDSRKEETVSDWDALTSCESDDESAMERQAKDGEDSEDGDCEAPTAKEAIPNSAAKAQEGRTTSAYCDTEVESEDDCMNQTVVAEAAEVFHSVEVASAIRSNVQSASLKAATTSHSSVASQPKRKAETLEVREPSEQSTLEDTLFVGCVVTMLVAYVVACVYSFFNPLVVPFPSHETLHSAYDITNVSVEIMSPGNDSQITPQGVAFEWQLANFPVDALRKFGSEVFQYRIYLDEELVTSEIGFLSLSEDDDTAASVLNRTVRLPIPARSFVSTGNDYYKLHLEVSVPVPGLIGELQAFEKDVYVKDAIILSPEEKNPLQLQLTAPENGATFALNQSIVLEYTAASDVQAMDVLIDGAFYLKKTYASDGNLLFRGLGVGPHTFELRVLDDWGEATASAAVQVEVVESPEDQSL
ncbi:hypothetical protein BBJ28_00024089 [Nothophytophthora sp. Chile5]|nr:hypothetical protein BBJ28_00024089 [Nothophytophthora sp. Chile5]